VPRHNEINEFLVRKICRDLEIPSPRGMLIRTHFTVRVSNGGFIPPSFLAAR